MWSTSLKLRFSVSFKEAHEISVVKVLHDIDVQKSDLTKETLISLIRSTFGK